VRPRGALFHFQVEADPKIEGPREFLFRVPHALRREPLREPRGDPQEGGDLLREGARGEQGPDGEETSQVTKEGGGRSPGVLTQVSQEGERRAQVPLPQPVEERIDGPLSGVEDEARGRLRRVAAGGEGGELLGLLLDR